MEAEILRRAIGTLKTHHRKRRQLHDEKTDGIFNAYPELSGWRELQYEAQAEAVTGFERGDLELAFQAQEKHERAQAEIDKILVRHGISPSELEFTPECALCGDSLYIGKNICQCVKNVCARLRGEEVNNLLPVQNASFSSFDLTIFSDENDSVRGFSQRDNMRGAYERCKEYAKAFSPSSGKNLFFNGETGLGKTYLSCCVARAVADMGYTVRYESAVECFSRAEAEKFDREGAEYGYMNLLTECDLLILDDLGTEFMPPGSYAHTALYHIVNTRLSGSKPMIISSNLLFDELQKRYIPQVVSRLKGNFELVSFFGNDVRLG